MLKLTERQCLLKALGLVKDRKHNLHRAFGQDIPNRAYKEWMELLYTADYLEGKLFELNEREGLYEYQDGYRQREQGDNAVSVREGSHRE